MKEMNKTNKMNKMNYTNKKEQLLLFFIRENNKELYAAKTHNIFKLAT